MKNNSITLGIIKDTGKELKADLGDLSFCLAVGGYGSGKSVWLDSIYKQLENHYSPEELGYVILCVAPYGVSANQDYVIDYKKDQECMGALAEYAELARQRANGHEAKEKHLVVHIEGSDLAFKNRSKYLSLIALLANNTRKANMSLVIVANRANENETPPEITKLCSLITLFSGANYSPNAKYLNLKPAELNQFEKHLIINGSGYNLLQSNNDLSNQNSEEEQETEITFIHTLPPEFIEKLRKRQQGGGDS